MGFLYYMPGVDRSVTIEKAREAGLGYAFGKNLTARGVSGDGGPDGNPGAVLVNPDLVDVSKVGYFPKKQTWCKIPGLTAWVGFYNDNRPGPAQLARAQQLRGHLVTLADGNSWLVPVARGMAEEDGEVGGFYVALPRISRLGENGEWEPGDIEDQFQMLWDLACRWFYAKFAATEDVDDEATTISMTFDSLHADAVSALAQNYHIGPAEASILGLLTMSAARDILDATIDMPTFALLLKKTSPFDGSDTDDGPSGDSPDTDQP